MTFRPEYCLRSDTLITISALLRRKCGCLPLIIAVWGTTPLIAHAEAVELASPSTQPGMIEFVIDASPPATLPLSKLLPALTFHASEGNAGAVYLKAFMISKSADNDASVDHLLGSGMSDFQSLEGERAIKGSGDALNLMREAAGCRECDWGTYYRDYEVDDGLLPLQSALRAARTLALKCKVEVATHHFDSALESLRIGFDLSERLGNVQARATQFWTAILIGNLFLDRLTELVQTSQAPNLYWSAASIRRPFFDLPGLVNVERRTAVYARLDIHDLIRLPDGEFITTLSHVISNAGVKKSENDTARLNAERIVAVDTVPARKWLKESGYGDDEISHITNEQAVAACLLSRFHSLADNYYCWAALPLNQAAAGYKRGIEEIEKANNELTNPLLSTIVPMQTLHGLTVKFERRTAMLLVVEALRGYAGAHDGKFPPSLDDLTETPAPLDPLSQRPFIYQAGDHQATLRAVTPLSLDFPSQAYHLTLAPKQ